jgi:hypothetical protein
VGPLDTLRVQYRLVNGENLPPGTYEGRVVSTKVVQRI